MEEFELTLEEIEKVSGGFRESDLSEEDRNRHVDLHHKAFEAWRKARKDPSAKQEYDIAFKEMQAYHFEILDKIHRLKPMNMNQ